MSTPDKEWFVQIRVNNWHLNVLNRRQGGFGNGEVAMGDIYPCYTCTLLAVVFAVVAIRELSADTTAKVATGSYLRGPPGPAVPLQRPMHHWYKNRTRNSSGTPKLQSPGPIVPLRQPMHHRHDDTTLQNFRKRLQSPGQIVPLRQPMHHRHDDMRLQNFLKRMQSQIVPVCNVADINKSWIHSSLSRDSHEILEDFLAAKLEAFKAAPFTSHVQLKDFPMKVIDVGVRKNHCRLKQQLGQWLQQGKPLRIGLAGGSASTVSCNSHSCKPGFTYLARTQEQMGLLTDTLRASSSASSPGPVATRNLAQGSTDSMWSSFTFESMLDISRYDILVWEFAINDSFVHFRMDNGTAGGGMKPLKPLLSGKVQQHKDLSLILGIWLQRVSKASASLKKKPSIVLLYLWDVRFDDKSTFPGNATAWNAQLHVVQRYIANGMDISVLNAGAGLSGPSTKYILHDPFHPNCAGNQYISDVLVYYLAVKALQALKQSGSAPQTCNKDLDLAPGPATRADEPPPMRFSSKGPVEFQLHAMLHASRIRTLINWRPQDTGRANTSSIKASGGVKVETTDGAKSIDGRGDLKLAFKLPFCTKNVLKFHVANPGAVAALAFGFAGRHLFEYGKLLELSALHIRVDNVTVQPMPLGPAYQRIQRNGQWASFWVPVNEQRGDAKFTEGRIQICITQRRVRDRVTSARQLNFLAVLEGPLQSHHQHQPKAGQGSGGRETVLYR